MKQYQRLQQSAIPTLSSSLVLAALALFAASAASGQAPAVRTPAANPPAAPVSVETLRRNFANPPNEARPMVRWWWFGTAVVKPEILRELQQMKADGIQGAELAFEYPIVLDDPSKDLKNLPFLSPEMLDDVKYAQIEGRKLGLRIDVTLGSGWPYGGPATTLAEAATRLRTAQVPVAAGATSVNVPSLAEGESLLAADIVNNLAAPRATVTPLVMAPAPQAGPGGPGGPGGQAGAGRQGGAGGGQGRGGRGGGGGGGGLGGGFGGPAAPTYDAASAKPLTVSGSTASVEPSDKPRTALFFIMGHTRQQVKRAAVGADGWVLDPLSHEAVANYLKSVGEPLISAFGSTPPTAIFSDSLEAGGADWTPNLPAEFLKRRGYDLIPHLPELAAGGSPAADTVRHDYGRTLTELIDDNYMRQITAWAVAHHTKFRSQTYGDPAVSFSSQNLASLAEGEGPQWRSFSTLRWATSANHVFNHDITSGETFTWLHSPVFRAIPLDMKVEADIDFVTGENQIICHGWGYSPPDGEVPEPGWSLYAAASFNNHNPWHPVMPAVTAYIGRMSWLLRQGQPANQVAILLPTDDVWAGFAPGRDSVTGAMGRYVSPLMPTLLSAGYNVDFIDADAIDKVGIGAHQILLLPATDRIPVGTLRKIAAFTKAGGTAIALAHTPTMDPEGKVVPEIAQLTQSIVVVPGTDQLAQALQNAVPADFQFTATDDATKSALGFVRRKLPTADVYFVINSSSQAIDTTATFATKHKFAEAWDPESTASSAASATSQAIHLEPYGSAVYVFSDSPNTAKPAPALSKQLADLSSDWSVTFAGMNKTSTMATPTDWIADASTKNYSGEGVYTRDFTLDAAPRTPVYLEVEGGKSLPGSTPNQHLFANYDPPINAAALVTINGQPAGALWHPPYRLDVSKLLKAGTNHIEIKVYNTALNAWSAMPPRDYGPLIAKYGDRFQMQDLGQVKPISSGLLGTVHLVTTETK